MKIGTIEINSLSAGLAPMAGVADIAFRQLCRHFGCSFTTTEMVSAKGFVMGDRKSRELLTLPDDEHPSAIQLFGSNPDIMAEAAKRAMEFQPDVIDINMGCPAPKITSNGGGSALLKDLDKAESIIKAVCRSINIPVTVKMRLGWDDKDAAVELSKRAEQAGAAAITVHGRTRMQMYAPPVDIEAIAKVKNAVSIPVIANGDIFTPMDAKKMIEQTGCDFIVIGRGSLGRPWIFDHINAFLQDGIIKEEPTVEEKMEIMKQHIQQICLLKGEKVGIKEARKHAAWYVKGINGAAKFRKELSSIESIEQLENIAKKIEEQS